MSPELALVDAHLAKVARELLPGPGQGFARSPHLRDELSLSLGSIEASSGFAEDTAAAAFRRISESALVELELPRSAWWPALRGRGALALVTAIAVAAALVVLVVDRQASRAPRTVAAESRDSFEPVVPGVERSASERRPREPTRSRRSVESEVLTSSRAGSTERVADRKAVKPDIRSTEAPTVRSPPRARDPAGSEWALSSRRYAWQPYAGASSYHVELFRGRERVFVTDTPRPWVTIPPTWDLGGRTLERDPGDRLVVWPIAAGRRLHDAVVDAQVVDLP